MKQPDRIVFLLFAAAAALLAARCGENAFEPTENRPPETGLALTGDSLATTLYMVELKWWGSDADGEVRGFEYRWVAPEGAPTFDLDTAWTFTGFVKKEFLLPVPDSTASFRFDVRAVDEEGLADPTPATQVYPFFNNPPEVEIRFRSTLPDSAWPVLALSWDASDPEGDSTIAKHLFWIGGREEEPVEVEGSADTVLLLPADLDTFGSVTLFLQTIDESHGASAPDSIDIYFYPIEGNVLLVDDYDSSPTPFYDPDAFYREILTERAGESGHTVLDLKRTPFDTDLRFAGFLTAFDHLLWYSGTRQKSVESEDVPGFEQLALADSGIAALVDRGGGFFISSLNAVGSLGGLPASFTRQYAGFDSLYVIESGDEVTTNFSFDTNNPETPVPWEIPFLAVEGTGLPDLDMRDFLQYAGIDSPVDADPAFVAERLYVVPVGAFRDQPGDFYPAVRYDVAGPAGRVVLCTFPLSIYTGAENNDEVLHAFLDWLGVP